MPYALQEQLVMKELFLEEELHFYMQVRNLIVCKEKTLIRILESRLLRILARFLARLFARMLDLKDQL